MVTTEFPTLLEAVGMYLGSFKTQADREDEHRELFRFVQWCGPDRLFSEIEPPAIGGYADQVAGTGTTPQAGERLQIVRKFLTYAKKKGLTEINLATHVRIRRSKSSTRKVVTGNTQNQIELTSDGYNRLMEQVKKLKAERAPLAIEIKKAAADKDVRENAPLEAAREQLGHIESRIRDIENTLSSAVIMNSSKRGRVRMAKIGTQVSVKDLGTGRKSTFTLVDRAEANPLEGKISDISPLGKVLLGRSVGQEVEAETPRGKALYRILKVCK